MIYQSHFQRLEEIRKNKFFITENLIETKSSEERESDWTNHRYRDYSKCSNRWNLYNSAEPSYDSVQRITEIATN